MCQAYYDESDFVAWMEQDAVRQGHLPGCMGIRAWCRCPAKEYLFRDVTSDKVQPKTKDV